MKFFDPRGNIEKTAHKLPHWQQGGKRAQCAKNQNLI
jgi:hypothetical protein